MKKMIIIALTMFLVIKIATGAHFIVGAVEDALDGASANGKVVALWNQENGMNDNTTDIVGPTGNSGTNNIYMIDCELLQTPCEIGDNMTVQVINTQGYISEQQNVTVTGAGFDLVANLSLNSPLNITSNIVEDDLSTPINEIDLLPATTKLVTCNATIEDADNESEIINVSARFFDQATSSYESFDDNNDHYTNTSCAINTSFGDTTQISVSCSFQIEYYANPGTWNCTMSATDNNNNTRHQGDTTTMNQLLALGIDSPINYGIVDANNVSLEQTVNVTNYGNVAFNLSLDAYGAVEGDNLSMVCSAESIPVEHQKFNLSNSYPGPLTLPGIQNNYTNLSTQTIIGAFNLAYRTNDGLNDANKSTYWRIYAPTNIGGNCTGNIVFGAVEAAAT